MFTRCPNCDQKQELTVDQLRDARAIVFCPRCASNFDALERLGDSGPDAPIPSSGQEKPQDITSARPPEPGELIGLLRPSVLPEPNQSKESAAVVLPWEQAAQVSNPHWRTSGLAGLLLLLGQLLYFHSSVISQNHTLRRFCQSLHCPLPAYQNAAEWAIVSSVLEPLPDRRQLFKAIIINQADFAQAYPTIDLTLQDYAGNALARRRFRPEDYLLNAKTAAIKPNATAELRLHIAPTTLAVGGYTFDLTY